MTTITHQQEMTITHKDFMRLLPAAIDFQAYETVEDCIVIQQADQQVRIHLTPEKIRKLGWFELPVVLVTLTFENYSEAAVEAFMQRFHLYFQRGGG